MNDITDNTRFVKLTTTISLGLAEAIREALKANKVAAVIIGDEEHQNKDQAERVKIMAEGEPFRIEVPETTLERAREVLIQFQAQLKKGSL